MTPSPHLLHVRRRQEGAKDAHGNPVVSYAAPQEWWVRAIAPGASERPEDAHRDASHVLWTVYADADEDAPGAYDRVVLEGVEYELESQPADWTLGPWPHPTAGLVVELIHKGG